MFVGDLFALGEELSQKADTRAMIVFLFTIWAPFWRISKRAAGPGCLPDKIHTNPKSRDTRTMSPFTRVCVPISKLAKDICPAVFANNVRFASIVSLISVPIEENSAIS